MALTGVFNVDFSAFYDAVNQAQIKLVDFDADAGKVSRSLDRVNESLSGKKIMQEAAEITRVLEKMGGTAALTANEIASIGPKLNEAVSKMQAVGETVPANMAKYAAETKNATTALGGMTSAAASLAAALGVTFSIGALVNWTKELFNTADQMGNLATATGSTIGEIRKMQVVAAATGVDVDTLAKSTQTLQHSLSTTEGIDAILKLKIGFGELRSASPYDALKMTVAALGQIPDPAERARLASATLGNGWKETAKTMGADWDDLTKNVNTNVDEQIAAANRLKNALGGAYGNFKENAVENLGRVALAWEELRDKPATFAKNFAEAMTRSGNNVALAIQLVGEMQAKIKEADTAAKNASLIPKLPPLETLQNLATASGTVWQQTQLGGEAAAAASAKAAAAFKKQTEETEKLHDAYRNLNSAGSSWEATLAAMDQDLVATIAHYKEAGASADDLKRAFGVTDIQINAVSESLRAQQKALDDFDKDVEKTRELWISLGQTQIDRSGTVTDKMIADVDRWFATEAGKLKESDLNYAAHYTALQAVAAEKLNGIAVNWDQLKTASLSSLQDTAARAEATWAEAAAHQDNYSIQTIEALRTQADAAQAAVDNWNMVGTAADAAGGAAKAASDEATASINTQRGSVEALTGSFVVLTQTAAQWRAQAAGLLADAARIDQMPGASTTGWEWQYSQNLKTAAGRAMTSAGRQESLDTAIASTNTNAGAWGGPNYRQGWTVNVNGVVNGDQIANELVAGMRRRGVSPGAA